jgi:predicted Zn-dependent peptidase
MHLARSVLADACETLSDAEVQRARAQLEAGLLMGLESAQGRADHMARSIEVFGKILPLEELIGQLRDVDAAAARAAGCALLDGRAAVASVGTQLALAA